MFKFNVWDAVIEPFDDDPIEDRTCTYSMYLKSDFKDTSLSFELRGEGTKFKVGVRNCDWETWFAEFETESVESAKIKGLDLVEGFLISLLKNLKV